MELSKISLSGSGNTALAPQTPKNRFEQLTFSKHFEHKAIWNSIGQHTPSCLNTAMKVVTFLPLLLIEAVAKAVQAIGNAGVFALNTISNAFCGHTVEVLDTKSFEEPPLELLYNEPLIKTEEETVEITASEDTSLPSIENEPVVIEEISSSEEEASAISETEEPDSSALADEWELEVENQDNIQVIYPEPPVEAAPKTYSGYAPLLATVGLVISAALTYFVDLSGIGGGVDPLNATNNSVDSSGIDGGVDLINATNTLNVIDSVA